MKKLLLAVVDMLRFLASLRVVFRPIPHHTYDETIAIRGIASVHPAIPRWVARFRARVIDRQEGRSAVAIGDESEFLFSRSEIERCLATLKQDGIYVFAERLPASLLTALQRSVSTLPAYFRSGKDEDIPFRRGVDGTGLFDIRESDLMVPSAIQEYVTNPVWHFIAGKYFNAPPVHDETVAWWTFPQPAEFASLGAQMFHSDRRRLSFVKFFVYLTDVTTRNGPHVVVPGSHRHRPLRLRSDRRYEDSEVIAGCKRAPVEALGEAGTVIAVDTQALHKGKMLERDHRLILEIQLSTDLLGPASTILHNDWNEIAKARISTNPRVFQRFQ
ncbi:MAG TPA: phytanoyl-CoA dioxygenase family protein [Burkholderiales bacterium]|nr:phytanoyl-CoA dioxygenase family protein [Burkholderiales bacterium]